MVSFPAILIVLFIIFFFWQKSLKNKAVETAAPQAIH